MYKNKTKKQNIRMKRRFVTLQLGTDKNKNIRWQIISSMYDNAK